MAESQDPLTYAATKMRPLPHLIFMSRWLQLPLYLGLIVAQCVYVWHFWVELYYLVTATMGDQHGHRRRLRDARVADAVTATDRIMPGRVKPVGEGH